MKIAIAMLLLLGASLPAQAATYLFAFDSVADQDYSFTLDPVRSSTIFRSATIFG